MSHYTHLSIEEREKLYYLHGQGKSFREIARELKRAPSTITREYKRGRCWRNPYLPSRAQYRYEQRRKNCGRKRILSNPVYREKIRYYIEQLQWSPEQVSNRLKMEGASFQISWISIYRAIWAGVLDASQVRISYRRKADGKLSFSRGRFVRCGEVRSFCRKRLAFFDRLNGKPNYSFGLPFCQLTDVFTTPRPYVRSAPCQRDV